MQRTRNQSISSWCINIYVYIIQARSNSRVRRSQWESRLSESTRVLTCSTYSIRAGDSPLVNLFCNSIKKVALPLRLLHAVYGRYVHELDREKMYISGKKSEEKTLRKKERSQNEMKWRREKARHVCRRTWANEPKFSSRKGKHRWV